MHTTKSSANAADSPMSKKLKSCEPDLKIVVGEQKKIYHCHSVVMALASDYIDAALATPMCEQGSWTITFPEIHPDEWDRLAKFVLPIGMEAPPISLADVHMLAKWVDKYQFHHAKALFDSLLELWFLGVEDALLDDRAHFYVLACDCNLEKARNAGTAFFCLFFKGGCLDYPLPNRIIEKLIPIIQTNTTLWSAVKPYLGYEVNHEWRDTDQKSICANPLFPALLQKSWDLSTMMNRLRRVKIGGASNAQVNGIYKRVESFVFEKADMTARLFFCRINNDMWKIVEPEANNCDRIVYRCHMFSENGLPPLTGWKCVDDELASENLTIEYMMENQIAE